MMRVHTDSVGDIPIKMQIGEEYGEGGCGNHRSPPLPPLKGGDKKRPRTNRALKLAPLKLHHSTHIQSI